MSLLMLLLTSCLPACMPCLSVRISHRSLCQPVDTVTGVFGWTIGDSRQDGVILSWCFFASVFRFRTQHCAYEHNTASTAGCEPVTSLVICLYEGTNWLMGELWSSTSWLAIWLTGACKRVCASRSAIQQGTKNCG